MAQHNQFTCPSLEYLHSPDRWKDLSKVTIDYCETSALGKGCAELQHCENYQNAKKTIAGD
jgi:hypothetical protein